MAVSVCGNLARCCMQIAKRLSPHARSYRVRGWGICARSYTRSIARTVASMLAWHRACGGFWMQRSVRIVRSETGRRRWAVRH